MSTTVRAADGTRRPWLTAVPLSVSNPLFEQYYPEMVRRCTNAGVGRVFLCVSRCVGDEAQKQRELALLRRYVPRLKVQGFEVGVWFSSLGHGGTTQGTDPAERDALGQMVDLDGERGSESNCPLDPAFQALCGEWVQRLAETGVDIIMLDDDFRMSFRNGGRFCCCEHHRPLLEQALGEPFDAARMKQALSEGGPNRWRDAWLQAQGEGLRRFAKELRRALDEVRPDVRLCHCAVLSTWDVDGVDSLTLAKDFAGNTRPLLRLIGAPYWAALRNFGEVNLSTVCEYERLQQDWAVGSGVEIFCEGDVYPRPRYTTPAAYLEGFDEVMQAAGTSDGILKYMLDYCASPAYETGYYDRHLRNKGIVRSIHKQFDGKQAVGVTVFEPMHTLAVSHAPGSLEGRCPPASLRFVTDNNLPVRYDAGEDATVIFGDAAELATPDQLLHGAILDAAAARILQRRGFDVGVAAVGEQICPTRERYLAEKETVAVYGGRFVRLQAAKGAELLSVLLLEGSDPARDRAPGCFRYQNNAGQRFLIYAFDARYSVQQGAQCGIMRGWCRAAQLRGQLAWLARRAPDALCDPAPDLYMLVKRDAHSLTVGLWNFGVDSVFCPRVQLGTDWPTLLPGTSGAMLVGRTVTLPELAPFGHAHFTLTLDAAPTPLLPAAPQPQPAPQKPALLPYLAQKALGLTDHKK